MRKSNLKHKEEPEQPTERLFRVYNGFETESNDFVYKVTLTIFLVFVWIYGLYEFSKALFS